MPYYGVRSGRSTGVYTQWDECRAMVAGFSGALYKKFATLEEARAFVTDSLASDFKGYVAPMVSLTRANSALSEQAEKDVRKVAPMPASTPANDVLMVYTDGACKGNGRNGARAGWGVYFGEGSPRNKAARLDGPAQTNQRAELAAMVYGLREILTDISAGKASRGVLRTDSKYGINCVATWGDKWEKNGWKGSNGQLVANKDLIQEARALYHGMDGRGKIKLEHVRGHAGVHGNERADQLANRGADM